MASPVAPIVNHRPPPPLTTLTDELLEEIFLRLPTPTDLARACTACASFRRIITDRSFLRRFRAIHPPPLLGFAAFDGLHHAQPPHPSAPLARALADAADFSFSFVPTESPPWYPRDIRQGRVLLMSTPDWYDSLDFHDLTALPLAVCDPLCRRYVLLPEVPNEITVELRHLTDFGFFLAPTAEDEDDTSFRVICTASNETGLFAIVFSSITAKWQIIASSSWSSLGTAPPSASHGFIYFSYAGGCFYFTVPWRDKLLVLDALRMEFSIVNKVPSGYLTRDHGLPSIVMGAKGSPLMVFFGGHNEDGSTELLHVFKLNDCESSNQWQLEKIIPLPRQSRHYTLGAAEEFVFLFGIPNDLNSLPETEYLSLNITTSELKKVCGIEYEFFGVRPYFGFPLSLSKPCI
ncbi:unnamed protein product [Urochloa decumbens]|uniref:F-box domain-containing protein n=1 Tax=Urochloa decumbens TaxID=240449 RepID=A0ABC9C3N0_9POAL